MPPDKATESLIEALQKVIDYHRQEWHVTYAIAVGCLEMVKHDLLNEASNTQEEDE